MSQRRNSVTRRYIKGFFRGGLQPGDIVTHIDGKPIKRAQDVYDLLRQMTASKMKMSVQRQGKQVELQIQPEDSD